MAKRKFDLNKLPHVRIPKKTSQAPKRPKKSSMNKHKRRCWKAKNRGGS